MGETMSPYMPGALASPRLQLLATAILSGATAACLLLGYQAREREERLSELKSSIPSLTEADHGSKKVPSSPSSAMATR